MASHWQHYTLISSGLQRTVPTRLLKDVHASHASVIFMLYKESPPESPKEHSQVVGSLIDPTQ